MFAFPSGMVDRIARRPGGLLGYLLFPSATRSVSTFQPAAAGARRSRAVATEAEEFVVVIAGRFERAMNGETLS